MRNHTEILLEVNKIANEKSSYTLPHRLVLAFMAGAYIALGALLSVQIGFGFPGIAAENIGLVRLLMGAVFPIGLIMVVIIGSDLFTGNCAYYMPNLLSGRVAPLHIAKALTITWFANFAGALFVGYVLTHLTALSSAEPTAAAFMRIAEAKTSPSFFTIFLKGIGANWLVCVALLLGLSSTTVAGKIIGLWFPIMAFVAIGFEHSIANMFFIPVAMMEGFDLSVTELFMRNLIPATLGNMVGGGLFVGALYWYLYDE